MEFEIMLALARDETHVRQLARLVRAPHPTVLRILWRLEKMGVLDCRTEGRNKVYFIRKNLKAQAMLGMAERYKLIKAVESYPSITPILQDILKATHAPLVVLFGGYAKFSAKGTSDLDIFIETQDEKAKMAVEAVHSSISAKIGPMDPRSPLVQEMARNHVILRGEDEFYERLGFFEQNGGGRAAGDGGAVGGSRRRLSGKGPGQPALG